MREIFLFVIIILFFQNLNGSVSTKSVAYLQNALNAAINDGLKVCQRQIQLKYPVVYHKSFLQSFSFKILDQKISYHLIYSDNIYSYVFDTNIDKIKWSAEIKNISVSQIQKPSTQVKAQASGVIILNVTKLNSNHLNNQTIAQNKTSTAENNQKQQIALYQNEVPLNQNQDNNTKLIQNQQSQINQTQQNATIFSNLQSLFSLTTNN